MVESIRYWLEKNNDKCRNEGKFLIDKHSNEFNLVWKDSREEIPSKLICPNVSEISKKQ